MNKILRTQFGESKNSLHLSEKFKRTCKEGQRSHKDVLAFFVKINTTQLFEQANEKMSFIYKLKLQT